MAVQPFPAKGDIAPSFEDTRDFEDADRGFVTSLNPCLIKDARGKTVWNNDDYNFVSQRSCPSTVNPKLWRQAQLLSKQGLYRLSPSIYQVRGFDISHITFVEGKTGIIVIDPLISCECAAAALQLYQTHRGPRPVKAIVYSHSHIDHFGGADGVLPTNAIPIIAPDGFMEEAASENVFAGPIMRARSGHMYGKDLPRSPLGQIGVGIGMGTSRGTTSLVPPTLSIKSTGEAHTLDGVRIIFQMVPNTEAPAEMNMYFPSEKVLLVPECAVHSMHNIITLRGALVRDAKAWAKYLDETISLFCESAESTVLFASHSWPIWGDQRVRRYLEEQRDLYAYLHDQTVRLMNAGWNGTEIAEKMVLPPRLRRAWHAQGFYGSVSHNVKGIYQRYMTWFDGSAENLWKWPPKEEGARYVKCMGGAREVLKKAKEFMVHGDLRFAATLLGHVVAAGDQADLDARRTPNEATGMLALAFEKLGFGSENATWRNVYLSQASNLRQGKKSRPQNRSGNAMFGPGLSVEQWFDSLAICIDGERAGEEEQEATCIDIDLKDTAEKWTLILSNGVLTSRRRVPMPTLARRVNLALILDRTNLQMVLSAETGAEVEIVSGEILALNKLLSFAKIRGVDEESLSRL